MAEVAALLQPPLPTLCCGPCPALDAGLWAAVPVADAEGRRESLMVRSFKDIPRDADRVIFFPRAAGGR